MTAQKPLLHACCVELGVWAFNVTPFVRSSESRGRFDCAAWAMALWKSVKALMCAVCRFQDTDNVADV